MALCIFSSAACWVANFACNFSKSAYKFETCCKLDKETRWWLFVQYINWRSEKARLGLQTSNFPTDNIIERNENLCLSCYPHQRGNAIRFCSEFVLLQPIDKLQLILLNFRVITKSGSIWLAEKSEGHNSSHNGLHTSWYMICSTWGTLSGRGWKERVLLHWKE